MLLVIDRFEEKNDAEMIKLLFSYVCGVHTTFSLHKQNLNPLFFLPRFFSPRLTVIIIQALN